MVNMTTGQAPPVGTLFGTRGKALTYPVPQPDIKPISITKNSAINSQEEDLNRRGTLIARRVIVSFNALLIFEHTKHAPYKESNDFPPETDADAELINIRQGRFQQRPHCGSRGTNVINQHAANNNNVGEEQSKTTPYWPRSTLVGAGMANWLYADDGTAYYNNGSASAKLIDLTDPDIVVNAAHTRRTIGNDTAPRSTTMQMIANHVCAPTPGWSFDIDRTPLLEHNGTLQSLMQKQRAHSAGDSEVHARRGEDR